MKKFRLLGLAAVAVAAMAMGTASASAVTVSPAGSISASFPAGGLTFRTALLNTSCAISFSGNVTTTGGGSITAASIANPCGGVTYTFLSLPTPGWAVSVGAPSAGLVPITISGIGVNASVLGINCLFSGSITMTVANGGTRILAPSGTLTGPCGTATVGGTGGTLSPAQTVS